MSKLYELKWKILCFFGYHEGMLQEPYGIYPLYTCIHCGKKDLDLFSMD